MVCLKLYYANFLGYNLLYHTLGVIVNDLLKKKCILIIEEITTKEVGEIKWEENYKCYYLN